VKLESREQGCNPLPHERYQVSVWTRVPHVVPQNYAVSFKDPPDRHRDIPRHVIEDNAGIVLPRGCNAMRQQVDSEQILDTGAASMEPAE
jgi:hypothetical protein